MTPESRNIGARAEVIFLGKQYYQSTFPWQQVTMELLYMHFRDNARLGMLVAVELQVLPWQRVLRQAVAADTKYIILQGGASYPGRRE
jgi:hypothetical protein